MLGHVQRAAAQGGVALKQAQGQVNDSTCIALRTTPDADWIAQKFSYFASEKRLPEYFETVTTKAI